MRALTWQGPGKVSVETVEDPRIQEPTDAIVRVTSTAICGSDLHLYTVLSPFLHRGDVLGHEFMGIVEAVGSSVTDLRVGDRVVVPFNISCGRCWMCQRGLFAQCETTQNTEQDAGASLFGYTDLYGAVPGGQAEYVRVPHADFGPIRLPEDGADEHFLYLSDILPTAWQGVQWANVRPGDTLVVMGAGPVGQLAVASAQHLGIEDVIVVDRVPERLERMRQRGARTIDLRDLSGSSARAVGDAVRDLTHGRGADGALDAVGMEAHGNPIAHAGIAAVSRLPSAVSAPLAKKAGVDRLSAVHAAIDAVRRGGTVSISGVYGGNADPMPMMQMFDKGITVRMGQCHVKQWTGELLQLLQAGDPFGVDQLATHRVDLEEAPQMYEIFQKKQDGCQKVVLRPGKAA
ncbi:glutathione-dependent formaldehyde dehydrogenase [Brachybacterium sp. EF45031]|uniref:zinc-dependent alcohol dehydrogenase n=1 Tax=Brachybacterium sillae TaxID=2810536 RepID=UPI00217D8BF4|nr:zinc-dependent alcohol dehydrogenase [Brachybacterium sillae]MCS6711149.1 glutathione-dependent formaldehyde dehydrogenase [Brachybacterium sillae]